MYSAPHVLLLDAAPARGSTMRNRLRERGLPAVHLGLDHPGDAGEAIQAADVVMLTVEPAQIDEHADGFATWLEQLAAGHTPTLVWGMPDNCRLPTAVAAEYLPPGITLDEVIGRLTMLARYAPLVKRLDSELAHMQRIGQQLQRYLSEIDKEMRLAGRLQRNFLPRTLPQLPRLRTACLFRPATWVSGDVYDIYPIDEHKVGVFIADAMGHGTAAALMTMFLRQALLARRVVGKNCRSVPPVEVMQELNACLIEQQLPDFQFVTAACGIFDSATLELRLARGGHPYALHIDADGHIRELVQPGNLLGLAELEPEFAEIRLHLEPGDKVVLYTDGLEENFIRPRGPESKGVEFTSDLQTWAGLDATAFVDAVAQFLDRQEGSLNPADDVTIIVLEVPR